MLRMNYISAACVMTMLVPAAAFAQSANTGVAASTTTAAAPAAQTAPATGAAKLDADGKVVLAPGTEVYDTQGGRVGQLTKVEGNNVVLKTAKNEVLIPASSLARTEKNALIAMTAAQIDAAAAAAKGGQAPATSQAN